MKAQNIEEFFGTLQQSTVEAWKKHLKTDKYSAHIALNEFYEDIVELVDTLIENYQGLYGKVKNYKNLMSTDEMSAIDYLEELKELTKDARKTLIKEDDSELQSDIDAILSLIDSTLYKLKELKENKIMNLKDYLLESLLSEATFKPKDFYVDGGDVVYGDETIGELWDDGTIVFPEGTDPELASEYKAAILKNKSFVNRYNTAADGFYIKDKNSKPYGITEVE